MTADFNALVERAVLARRREHMRPVIEKELLHYDILFALDSQGLLDLLTFQGGTSLRLCYGSPRFSEDLYFVSGKGFDARVLGEIKSCVEQCVGDRYGLEISVKEPKDLAAEKSDRNVQVRKWQLRLTTAPARRDLPKQMIKIEVADVPAYSREPQLLRQNYDFLPDGYGDLIILVESLDEIMADKLISLPSCTSYVRHRDIWDLHWLKQQGATLNAEWLRNKLRDYGVAEYGALVGQLIERLPEIIQGREFKDQMSRFLPVDVQERTLAKPKFLSLLITETTRALSRAAEVFRSAPATRER